MSVSSATQSPKTPRLDEEDPLVLSADVQEKAEIDFISGNGFKQVAALFSTSSITPFSKPVQKNFIPTVDNPFSKSSTAFQAPDFSLTVPFDQLQLAEKKSTPPSAISTYVSTALSGIQKEGTVFFQPIADQADRMLLATPEQRAALDREQVQLALEIACGIGLSGAVVKTGRVAISGAQKAIAKGKQIIHEIDNAPPKHIEQWTKPRYYKSDLAPSRELMHDVTKGPREKKTMIELFEQLNKVQK